MPNLSPAPSSRPDSRERCEACDKPIATVDEWKTVGEGERDDLCWGLGANCEEIDWRARALAAEAEVERLEGERDEYRDLWDGGRQNTADFEARAKAAESERDELLGKIDATLNAFLTEIERLEGERDEDVPS